VIRFKVLTYSEFLKLEPWELAMFCEGLKEADRDEWERTRFQSYITAQCQSTKKMKPTDIIKFDWDNEGKKQTTTKQQFEEYKKKMGY
jgi:hypothetical protein